MSREIKMVSKAIVSEGKIMFHLHTHLSKASKLWSYSNGLVALLLT